MTGKGHMLVSLRDARGRAHQPAAAGARAPPEEHTGGAACGSGAETRALRQLLRRADQQLLVTSALSRAELLRAAGRHSSEVVTKALEVLAAITSITITAALLDQAGSLAPSTLRTLDAIHLATALELGEDLTAFVAYDARLLAAAANASLPTLEPA
jgi:predicted nucleic acid-binding protein